MPLDIGAGILLSLLTAEHFNVDATPAFIAIGILLALLPDIDIVWYLFGKPARHYDHRSIIHHPLLYIPLALGIYIFFGKIYATLFALCILLHFIHDTVGIGWGVAWLAPFSYRKFRLLSPAGPNGTWELFRTWMPKEEAALAEHQHDPNWVKHYYLEPNLIGFVEYAVLLVSLLKLFLYFH